MVVYAAGHTDHIDMNEDYGASGNPDGQENYEYENERNQNADDGLNNNLLNNDGKSSKKKNKYISGMFKSKNEKNQNTDENGNVPYRSFNEDGNEGEKGNSKSDNQKFSEVYNSIYEDLKKKKSGIKQKHGNNNSYEINYSSDHANSMSSSVDGDSIFNDDILKRYAIGQIFNTIRTAFHWSMTPLILFFLFEQYSVFFVYRFVAFLILLLFTPVSLYLIKKQNIRFFLLATNTTRAILWGACIPLLYYTYQDYIKKYYLDGAYEFLFCLLIILDNMCINLSSILDIDNNGIDYISKKFDIKVTEKAHKKYLTLHQFFSDISFALFNPLIAFVMYLFSRFFAPEHHRDLFVYLTSLFFAVTSIVSLVVYTIGIEEGGSSLKKGQANDNNYELETNADNVEGGNAKDETNENDFDEYYEKNISNKPNQYVSSFTNVYPSINVMQSHIYNIDDNRDPYSNKEIITLKDQYKKHFSSLGTGLKTVFSDFKLLYYLISLSFLNSAEDIATYMIIPMTSVFICEYRYIEKLFVKVLISIVLTSLAKCFENASYYCNKKNIVTIKDHTLGMFLSGFALVIFMFPFLLIDIMSISIFLVFFTICAFLFIFFSTHLKAKYSHHFQKRAQEYKSDIHSFAGIFMSLMNSIFIICVLMIFSYSRSYVTNHAMICMFYIIMLFILSKIGNIVWSGYNYTESTKVN
ncbi:conserved Plasmodium membrane protein, unknown function [Plasmodium vinckei brucechwatti]|uniref:Transporter n=1 Tax=Plasmodium vinckei brucechwatti TaxID=119398 RepID=A0A6V7RWZ5_PLAVN|nr:conserved Plasmodium membrane protein, unknown function [Plasmodium vinckei brucechwatti]